MLVENIHRLKYILNREVLPVSKGHVGENETGLNYTVAKTVLKNSPAYAPQRTHQALIAVPFSIGVNGFPA